ncbi:YlaF family protein [Weizmannia sp. FSL W8-0676]|uniref:YlaF family protein n=1 Tax=Heyndrickxia TaxID=2837504 RepID=UPI00034DDDA6|nr:YlaF family protein [Heyndrickxia coagulans]
MREIKWVFVFFSLAAFLSMCGIGVAIGAQSVAGILGCTALLITIMGFGFKTKKKMREEGKL